MICDICKSDTQVIDSRLTKKGHIKRRRRCLKTGHTFSTLEVPLSPILRKLRPDSTKPRETTPPEKIELILRMRRVGNSYGVIAKTLGMPRSTVENIVLRNVRGG